MGGAGGGALKGVERLVTISSTGPPLILQPEIVIFMAVGRLVGGSGRHERGPACGVATTTSATGGLDQLRGRRPVRRTGAGSRCRSTGSAPTVVGGGRAR